MNTIKKFLIAFFIFLLFQIPLVVNSQTETPKSFSIQPFQEECLEVAVDGSYAYAVSIDGLLVFDIRKPGEIIKISELAFHEASGYICISGNYLYLMTEGYINIVSVSNPFKPVCLYKCPVFTRDRLCGIGADSNNLFIIYNGYLDVFSLKNPLCPALLTSYTVKELAGADCMAGISVRNGTLYIAMKNRGIMIFDTSDVYNIKPVSKYISSHGSYGKIDFAGDLAIFGNSERKSSEIFDISNIRNPRYLGKIKNMPYEAPYFVSITAGMPGIPVQINNNDNNDSKLINDNKNKHNKDKVAYITIDDGPSRKITAQNLDTLKKYGVKATFFVLPKSNLDDIYRRIIDEGHVIGNHSCSHDYNYLFESADNFKEDVIKAKEYIYNKFKYNTTVFRFPGGSRGRCRNELKIRTEILSELGYKYFDWDATMADTDPNLRKYGTEEQIVELLVDNIVNGTKDKKRLVILMHDSSDKIYSAKALPRIIEALDKKGYTFDVLTNY